MRYTGAVCSARLSPITMQIISARGQQEPCHGSGLQSLQGHPAGGRPRMHHHGQLDRSPSGRKVLWPSPEISITLPMKRLLSWFQHCACGAPLSAPLESASNDPVATGSLDVYKPTHLVLQKPTYSLCDGIVPYTIHFKGWRAHQYMCRMLCAHPSSAWSP